MALPEDFNKIYGSTATGGLTPISDVDYAKGWEFVGGNPPTKNDFSYLQNLSDLKSQWLHSNKLQRTDPFGDIKADGASAIAAALSNLGLGEAAKKNVGTGANQIPDMNSFTFGSTTTADWYKLPGGLLIQSGINAVGYIGSPFTIGLPVAFSNANYRIVASYDNARADATYGFAMSALPSTASAFTINSSSNASVGPVYAYWIAIGKY